MAKNSDKVVLIGEAAAALREDFLHWQCRLRQMAMREGGGRPSAGMRPVIFARDDSQLAGSTVVLLHKADTEDSTAFFRHQVLKTQDPVERWEKATEHMAAGYFQRFRDFDDTLTALFGPGTTLVDQLLGQGKVYLDFAELSQRFRLLVKVTELSEHDPLYQATYWHNRMFNPNIPAGVRIVSFSPDWGRSEGESGFEDRE
ncbi:hypothetical protein [Dongia rigui]|uniref:Uncharacterized protein n=1 Tax=Dongia rigui TaxID=940149 RepID=A0ABU5E013_9PROT|nr:hypothetical protein [Dongia rigui]MDY0872875.1 hypothetical protein [Dongia rigui]